MQLERVADHRCELGEGPVWHPGEGRLYWVDIDTGRLLAYDPATGDSDCVYRDDVVTGLTIQRDGSLLLFMDRGRVGHWRDGELETVTRVVDSETRFNDVVADPAGRVFCGTMPTEAGDDGCLYRLDRDGSATLVESDVAIPNGLGFTPDRQRCYFTESDANTIHLYDYDEATGRLSNRRPFVETDDETGVPDGLTVDVEGYVWSARWRGACVVRYDPAGNETARYEIPAEKTTSVAFGGPDLDTLYVTTAGGHERTEAEPHRGALFALDPGVRGVVEFRSEVTL